MIQYRINELVNKNTKKFRVTAPSLNFTKARLISAGVTDTYTHPAGQALPHQPVATLLRKAIINVPLYEPIPSACFCRQ